MPRIPIHDLDDPRLSDYRALPRSNLTRHAGRFIAEGRLLVERLAASRFPLISVVCSSSDLHRLPEGLPEELPVYVLPKRQVSELIGFQFHRGMLACGKRQANPMLAELHATELASPIVVVCPQVVDPTNLGAIIRNGCAFGVGGLLLGPGCADPYSRRVIRVSMGNCWQLPIRESPNLAEDLQTLRQEAAFEIVGTVLDPTAEPLVSAGRTRRLALLFGSEGHGLTPDWIQLCDRTVTLPMQRNTDSLNVAVATGVMLYHFTTVATRDSND